MSLPTWTAVLATELETLRRWTAVSLLDGAGDRPPAEAVIVLQPRYGSCVHFLRRAAVFAAVGLPVRVYFGPEAEPDAERTTLRVAEALGTVRHVDVRRARPSAGDLADPACLVVLTGRAGTGAALRPRVRGAFSGACGSGLIVAGTEIGEMREVWRTLAGHAVEPSCTAPTGMLTVRDEAERCDALVALRSHHPAGVVWTSGEPLPSALADSGYWFLSADGATLAGRPFCDPRFGWPGDYPHPLPPSAPPRSPAISGRIVAAGATTQPEIAG